MSTVRFDDLIHAPTRLGIVSLLAASQWADFKFIRDSLGLSDSALSKQLTILEEAGYVQSAKGSSASVPAPQPGSPLPGTPRSNDTSRRSRKLSPAPA